ncbi:MAG: tetratricopeptide repeat protein [Dissulfurispiraceae bacterium]
MSRGTFIAQMVFFIALILLFSVTITSAETFLEEGIAEYRAENYDEALESFLQANAQEPGSSSIAYHLGLTYEQLGNYPKAKEHFIDAITLSPPENNAYIGLIDMLYSLDNVREAREWMAKAEKIGINPARLAYTSGLILLKENRPSEAIDAFKKAKELDSSLAQQSNFQIAVAQTNQRKYAEAKETLRALMTVDPTSDLATFANEYERAIERTVNAYKAWQFSVGVAYQYDDNVVLQPSGNVAPTAISGQRDSSFVGTFRANYSPLFSGPWSLNAQYNFYSNTYRTLNTYNQIDQSVSLIPAYNFKQGAVFLPLTYDYVLVHESGYLSMFTAKPTGSVIIAPGHLAQFSVGYQKLDYYYPLTSPDENQDGSIYSASAAYIHPFAGGKGALNLRYELSVQQTEGVNWANTGNRITAGLVLPLMNRLNLVASGDIFLQDYKNVNTFFGIKRQDKTYTGSATLVYEIIRNLNLNVQYTHVTANSNIPLYEYNRNLYTVGVEFNF